MAKGKTTDPLKVLDAEVRLVTIKDQEWVKAFVNLRLACGLILRGFSVRENRNNVLYAQATGHIGKSKFTGGNIYFEDLQGEPVQVMKESALAAYEKAVEAKPEKSLVTVTL